MRKKIRYFWMLMLMFVAMPQVARADISFDVPQLVQDFTPDWLFQLFAGILLAISSFFVETLFPVSSI